MSTMKIKNINSQNYLISSGYALEKAPSGMEFTLSENLTFTTTCYYRTDFDLLSAYKIIKNGQHQDFTFSLTLKLDGTVEFIGPKGVIQSGKWIASTRTIIIVLEDSVDSSIKTFELIATNNDLATYQANIESSAASYFSYDEEDLFAIAWTATSQAYFDGLVH